MRITQGTFSFLPELTDEEIATQVRYCIENGWAVSIEYTDDAHPRNAYWEMWGLPRFDLSDSADLLREMNACRQAFPEQYIRVNGYDRTKGRQTTRLSFIVSRPKLEPGFDLERTEGQDRRMHYALRSRRRFSGLHQ